MSKLTLEVGKTYLTRDGKKAFAYKTYHYLGELLFLFSAVGTHHDFACTHDGVLHTQWDDGECVGVDNKYDLVSEYQDERLKTAVEALEWITNIDDIRVSKLTAQEAISEIKGA